MGKIENTGHEKLVSLVSQVFDTISQEEIFDDQINELSDTIIKTIIKKNLKANDQLCSSYIMSNLACCARSLLKYKAATKSKFTDDLDRLTRCYDLIVDAAFNDTSFRMQSCAADVCGFLLLNALINNDHSSILTWKSRWEGYLESALKDIDVKAELFSICTDQLLEGIGWVSKLLIGIFWLFQSMNSVQMSSWFRGYSFAIRALTLFVQEPPNSIVNELIVFTSLFATILRVYLPTAKTTCTITSLDSSRLKLNDQEIRLLKYGKDLSEAVTSESLSNINTKFRNLLTVGDSFSDSMKFIYDYSNAVGGTYLECHDNGSIGFNLNYSLFESEILEKFLSEKLSKSKEQLLDGPVEFNFDQLKDEFTLEVLIHDTEEVADSRTLSDKIKRGLYMLLENNLIDGYTTTHSFIMIEQRFDLRVSDHEDLLVERFYEPEGESIGMNWMQWMLGVDGIVKLPSNTKKT